MDSIVNFSKVRRVAVFLPYNKDINSEKKVIADMLRADGISADFYAVGSLEKGEYQLVGDDMFLSTSLLSGKTYRANVARMTSGHKVDIAFCLASSSRYEKLAKSCPAACRVGVNTKCKDYDFIFNGQGSPSELFGSLYHFVRTFE